MTEEEKEGEEEEWEVTDKIDVIIDQITEVEAEKADELAAKIEEKEERPRRPIDVT